MNKSNKEFSAEQCNSLKNALLEGHGAIIKDYISQGFNINKPCGETSKLTSMQIVAIKGHHTVMEYLHTLGANLNDTMANGWSLAHIAAFQNNIQMLNYLNNEGLNLNQQNHDGQTPLMVAAIKGNTGAAAALLKYHVATEMKDTFGQTALHTTALSCNNDIANLLKTYNANIHAKSNAGHNLLHLAAGRSCASVVQFALDNEISIDTRDNANLSAINIAFNSPILKLEGVTQVTSLQEYRDEQFYKTLDLLLEHGANINEKFLNSSFLHEAIAQSDLKLAKYLIKAGIDLESFNPYTALQIACINGDLEAAKLLVESGAETENTSESIIVTPLTNRGVTSSGENTIDTPLHKATPLSIAQLYKHDDLVKYLKDDNTGTSTEMFPLTAYEGPATIIAPGSSLDILLQKITNKTLDNNPTPFKESPQGSEEEIKLIGTEDSHDEAM